MAMHFDSAPPLQVPSLMSPEASSTTTSPNAPARVITDPVQLLSPVIEIFLPIGFTETATSIGLWFDTVGILTVFIQQVIIPDNIYTQVKILRFRLPVSLGLTIFSLGFGMFLIRSTILAIRASAAEVTAQIQKMLEQLMQKIKNGQLG